MPKNYVCIGYVPLFYVNPDKDLIEDESQEELYEFLTERVSHTPIIHVYMCLYGSYQDRATPIFVINKARDVIDHLLAYSEGDPTKYFKLLVGEYDAKYFLIIQPNTDQAILKFRRQQSDRGRDIPQDATINVIMKHIAFFSHRTQLLKKLDLSKPVHVGIIDKKLVDLTDTQAIPEPTFIGPFEIQDGSNMNIKHLFE